MKKAMAVILMMACCCSARGESEMFALDTRDGTRVTDRAETIRWSGLWEGDGNATVVVTLNNQRLVDYATGEGEFVWDELEPGTYTFKHFTFQNGVRVDLQTAVFEIGEGKTTTGVPYQWLEDWYLVDTDADREAYEEAAESDWDKDGFAAWKEYIAGTDPEDSESRFLTNIKIVDGVIELTWEPDANVDEPGSRTYTIQQLVDGEWKDVDTILEGNKLELELPDSASPGARLYRANVKLRE